MLKCVAPGCIDDASALLMGMSLCPDHKENWFQVQLAYFRTIPKGQLRSYQEFMEEYLKEHQAAGGTHDGLQAAGQ